MNRFALTAFLGHVSQFHISADCRCAPVARESVARIQFPLRPARARSRAEIVGRSDATEL
jgi:hypothetical protein